MPQEMAIAVWSPEPDDAGNSLAAALLEKLTQLGWGGRWFLMVEQDRLFARLARSTFRSRFRLGVKERQYCLDRGREIINQHAADFIRQRLAPAEPMNDGKRTPMRPSGIYRPACDRHLLPRLSGKMARHSHGRALSEQEQRYVVQVIHHWLVQQMNGPSVR